MNDKRKYKKFLFRRIFGTVTTQILAESISLNQSGSIFSVSYSVTGGALTQNSPPLIDDVVITGTLVEGQTLTATPTYYISSPYTLGSISYQWVRYSAISGGTRTVIEGATSQTYVLTNNDVLNYIGCEVVIIQSGGSNTTSETFISRLTDQITVSTTVPLSFNPTLTIRPQDAAADYATTGVVVNQGSLGGNTVPNTTIPELVSNTYFHIDALGNNEVFRTPALNYTRPVTIWMKFQMNQIPDNANLIGFSSINRIAIIGIGQKYQIKDSTNANAADNSAGTDLVVCKFTLNGNNSRVRENNSFDSGVLSAGTGGALNGSYHSIGMNHALSGEKADIDLYELYIYTGWNDADDAEMWTYFGF